METALSQVAHYLNAEHICWGLGGGLFAPNDKMTRAQAAAILERALTKVGYDFGPQAKMQAAPNKGLGIYNPTTNSNNLKDNGDGTVSLGNIVLSTSYTKSETNDQLVLTLNNFSKVSIMIDGDTVTVSVPYSGADNIWRVLQDTNGVFKNSKSVNVTLFDHSKGLELANCYLIDQNGNRFVEYQ